MAAKSKKRRRNEKIIVKLDELELKDVICPICQSIFVEPVTLPCYHSFCHACFKSSIENNALCCPLCRLRIGSWLRTTAKKDSIINIELWNNINFKFAKEIEYQSKGQDIEIAENVSVPRLSAPGEIRSEYEVELRRLQTERSRLEQKQLNESKHLIEQLQKEENEAQTKYIESLKQDELLALKIQKELMNNSTVTHQRKAKSKLTINKLKQQENKIDAYLSKIQGTLNQSAQSTHENDTTDESSPQAVPYHENSKSTSDKLLLNGCKIQNKENDKKQTVSPAKVKGSESDKTRKSAIKSLRMSLPLSKIKLVNSKNDKGHPEKKIQIETKSIDSMPKEMCYFKPIEVINSTRVDSIKTLPVRVPSVRAEPCSVEASSRHTSSPSRSEYLDGLLRLRCGSVEENVPSAFVIALKMLTNKNDLQVKCIKDKLRNGKIKSYTDPDSRVVLNNLNGINGSTKTETEKSLKRTRSLDSISKPETTPKKDKIKQRKSSSERKVCLRSDSKKDLLYSVDKVSIAVKNLSSPLNKCDMKMILEEQLRIEKMIEQEKKDLELARKMDMMWNGRRQPQRRTSKKRIPPTNIHNPAKKLKT